MRDPRSSSARRALIPSLLLALGVAAGAPAQVAVFDGAVDTSAGGLRFADGTLQTTAATGDADYGFIVVVDAAGGGDYTTINAALDAIGTTLAPASASSPYLVRIGAGIYSEQVNMKEWVDLEGAGEETTTITWTGASSLPSAYTVRANDNAELRHLTVENTGGAANAVGLVLAGVSPGEVPRVDRVTVRVSGGTGFHAGLFVSGGNAGLLERLTVRVTGGTGDVSAIEIDAGTPTLLEPDLEASGVGDVWAIDLSGSTSSVTVRGGSLRATSTGAVARGSDIVDGFGVLEHVDLLATAATSSFGLFVGGTPPKVTRVEGSRIEASGAGFSTAVSNFSDQPLEIRSSAIVVPALKPALQTSASAEIDVAFSLVDGDATAVGTHVCVASFDGSYAALGSNCL